MRPVHALSFGMTNSVRHAVWRVVHTILLVKVLSTNPTLCCAVCAVLRCAVPCLGCVLSGFTSTRLVTVTQTIWLTTPSSCTSLTQQGSLSHSMVSEATTQRGYWGALQYLWWLNFHWLTCPTLLYAAYGTLVCVSVKVVPAKSVTRLPSLLCCVLFVCPAGKNFTAEQLADSIGQHIAKWQQREAGDAGGSSSSDTRVKTGTAGSQEGLAQR